MERIAGPRSGKSLPGRDPAGRFGRRTRRPENGYGGRKRSRFLPPYFFVFRLSFPSPVGMPDVGVSMRGRVEKRMGRRSELCGFRFGTNHGPGRPIADGAFGIGKSFACCGVMAVDAGAMGEGRFFGDGSVCGRKSRGPVLIPVACTILRGLCADRSVVERSGILVCGRSGRLSCFLHRHSTGGFRARSRLVRAGFGRCPRSDDRDRRTGRRRNFRSGIRNPSGARSLHPDG